MSSSNSLPPAGHRFLQDRVLVLVGDITQQAVGAIVNAANSTLLGGGGVDGAIHRMGGPAILQACRQVRATTYPDGLPTGEAVITTAGNLPAQYVIHTVGPIYGQGRGREAELLASCYENSLSLSVQHSITSIAFPAISTGAFGYPKSEAAAISSTTIKRFLSENAFPYEVRLVFFQPDEAQVFLRHQNFE